MIVNETSIQTKYGLFDYASVENSIIDIRDIACGLAKINRFNGQSDIPFSVAQHSIFVTNLMMQNGEDIKIQKYGLMHDGHESYYCDFPRPLKRFLKSAYGFDINAITDEVDNLIFNRIFDLDPPTVEEKEKIKYYDNLALYNEKTYLFDTDVSWGWSMPLVEEKEFDLYLQGDYKYWEAAIVNRTLMLKNELNPMTIYSVKENRLERK